MLRTYKPKEGYARSNYPNDEAMKALAAGIPVKRACKTYKIPRSTLRHYLCGKSKNMRKLGLTTAHPADQELVILF